MFPDFLKEKTQEARSAGQILPLRFSFLEGQFFAVFEILKFFSKRQISGKRQLRMGFKLMAWVSSKPCRSPTFTHINVVKVDERRLPGDTPRPPIFLPLVKKSCEQIQKIGPYFTPCGFPQPRQRRWRNMPQLLV